MAPRFALDADDRIVPGDPPHHAGDEESLDVWGFRDSAFTVLPNGHVTLTGSRYPLSGAELPDLLPWTSRVLGVALDPRDTHDSAYPPDVPAPRAHPLFVAELRTFLTADAVTTDAAIRLRHGHGHTLEEMYAHQVRAPRTAARSRGVPPHRGRRRRAGGGGGAPRRLPRALRRRHERHRRAPLPERRGADDRVGGHANG